MVKELAKTKNTFNKVIFIVAIYQIISKLILVFGGFAFRAISGALMWSMDRPAITSGDLPFFLRSWQGWLVIAVGIIVLFFYVAIDINLTVILCDKLLKGEKINMGSAIKSAFSNMKKFFCLTGFGVVIYVAFIAPIVGAPFGLSLTRNFVVPDFITSFINANSVLKILYFIVTAGLLFWGLINIFTFHYALVKNQKLKEATKNSRLLMKNNWKPILKDFGIFLLKSIGWLIGTALITIVLPQVFIRVVNPSGEWNHFAIIFNAILFVVGIAVFAVLFFSFFFLKVTSIFGKNEDSMNGQYGIIGNSKKKPWVIGIVCTIACIAGVSGILTNGFDEYFPPLKDVSIIAHRGGGDLAHENTVLGVKAAIKEGVYGTETDIQRTKDGYYIINHDDNFSRLCGESRTSKEMTLEEIKKLDVKYERDNNATPTKIPTLEEFLDAGKDKIHFYLELKGETADKKMAHDVYQIVKDKGMLDQCCFIGMDYDLIKYIDKEYDDILTGYLCFFSVGEIEDLSCEILMPEMETATSKNIEKINDSGKRIDVWTVNTINGMFDFLVSNVDGIVTDNVEDAKNVKEIIHENSDLFRVLNQIMN